jgi:hypothetical protein
MSRTTKVLTWAVLAVAGALSAQAQANGPPGGVIRDTPYYGHHTTTRLDGMRENSHMHARTVRYGVFR